jgi:hypothetical protein
MYGSGDYAHEDMMYIKELKAVLLKCRKYIKKLPNKNELEKEMIIDLINTMNIE